MFRLCRRPRGTGFLKFSTAEAADAAVSAANAAPGLGIFIKSRALNVKKALDKESAHKKELEKGKNEVEDRRNLYLSKASLLVTRYLLYLHFVMYISSIIFCS